MALSASHVRLWLSLLAIAIFAMPANGAHWHLCLDGTEAPASVHLTDDAPHHAGEGVQNTHQDVDVGLHGEAVAKKFASLVDLPPLLAVAFVVFAVPAQRSFDVPSDTQVLREPEPTFVTLPPLRAPPV